MYALNVVRTDVSINPRYVQSTSRLREVCAASVFQIFATPRNAYTTGAGLPLLQCESWNARHQCDGAGSKSVSVLSNSLRALVHRVVSANVVFLERIRAAGGVAFMARDCRDVLRELQGLKGMT